MRPAGSPAGLVHACGTLYAMKLLALVLLGAAVAVTVRSARKSSHGGTSTEAEEVAGRLPLQHLPMPRRPKPTIKIPPSIH